MNASFQVEFNETVVPYNTVLKCWDVSPKLEFESLIFNL